MKKLLIALFMFSTLFIGCIYFSTDAYSATCSGVNTTILSCEDADPENPLGGVGVILREVVDILQYLIGTVAVAAIIYAGILYGTAAGNSEQIKKAISYIRNTVIGLIAYALMWLLLAWLVPGFDTTFF